MLNAVGLSVLAPLLKTRLKIDILPHKNISSTSAAAVAAAVGVAAAAASLHKTGIYFYLRALPVRELAVITLDYTKRGNKNGCRQQQLQIVAASKKFYLDNVEKLWQPGNPQRKGRLSTTRLHVQTSLDQLLLILQKFFASIPSKLIPNK
jgi:hypothetical protein